MTGAIGDITPNATIIIQMVNFWIAYAMLRALLFKPAYRMIMDRQEAEQGLRHTATATEKSIAQHKQERLALWQKCHDHFETHKPKSDQAGHATVSKIPAITPPVISPEARTKLTKQAYEQLVKQLETIDA